jgi:hypothetical protein
MEQDMVKLKKQKRNSKQGVKYYSFLTLTVAFSLFYFGCSDNQLFNSNPESDLNITMEVNRQASVNLTGQSNESLLKELRQATARFHSTEQATRAGYEVASPCVVASDPTLGAMGYHWINESLVDSNFEISKPEVVLYEPDKNGNLKLVAAEYIVINIGQERPYFGDYPFDIGGTPMPFPHWSLHIWLWKDNPNGIFTNYNPNVTCPD